jgi:hypothetical protein
LVTAFVEGGVEMGFQHVDPNAQQQTGLLFVVFHSFSKT